MPCIRHTRVPVLSPLEDTQSLTNRLLHHRNLQAVWASIHLHHNLKAGACKPLITAMDTHSTSQMATRPWVLQDRLDTILAPKALSAATLVQRTTLVGQLWGQVPMMVILLQVCMQLLLRPKTRVGAGITNDRHAIHEIYSPASLPFTHSGMLTR
jgi:hypothetical protein